jgi:hypothetical protein
MFVPDIPTVRPETNVMPLGSRISASASIPVAVQLAVVGIPDNVRAPPATVATGTLNGTSAIIPVEPLKADVPKTKYAMRP